MRTQLQTSLRVARSIQNPFSPLRRTPVSVRSRTMAAAATAEYNVVVKGDPQNKVLGDCPFCHRVLLTLETKSIPFTMDYVDFAHKPEWLVQPPPVGSGGKVPVLRGKDLLMPDSDVIVQYLEQQHPQPSMKPQVDGSVGSTLFPAFRQYLQASGPEEQEKKEAVTSALRALDEALGTVQGPLFGGQTIDQTDAAVAPKLYHISVALPHFKGYKIPEEFTRVHKYLAFIKTLPAWKAVDYGEASIIQGWSKHH